MKVNQVNPTQSRPSTAISGKLLSLLANQIPPLASFSITSVMLSILFCNDMHLECAPGGLEFCNLRKLFPSRPGPFPSTAVSRCRASCISGDSTSANRLPLFLILLFSKMRSDAVNLARKELSITDSAERPRPSTWLWQGLVLLVVLGFLYADTLARLVRHWIDDPDFSHGFFVPFFSAFVVWTQRKQLAAVPIKPAWAGLAVVAAALLLLIVGVLGAELFLARTSLVFLLAGLVIHFLGWPFFRALLFPLGFLFLMIPIPAIIFNQIAFPLQLFASRLAAELLPLLGVPTLRLGNVIQLPVMTLEVVEACSGIRSLVSLTTLAIIYGYLLEPRIWKRVVLAISAIPIAVAANGLRIVGTGLLGEYWDPEKAEGFFHTFSGWLIFVLSLLLLFAVHGLMKFLGRGPQERKA